MKVLLIFLITIASVTSVQKREYNCPVPINPTDELIDRELLQDTQRK